MRKINKLFKKNKILHQAKSYKYKIFIKKIFKYGIFKVNLLFNNNKKNNKAKKINKINNGLIIKITKYLYNVKIET